MLIKTNDMHMVIYLSALIRSVIALHDLVNNKIKYNLEEDSEDKKAAADKAGKDGKGEEEKKEDDGEVGKKSSDGEKKEKN